ncbi:chymotrypsin inhibitor [Amblyomma americanum]
MRSFVLLVVLVVLVGCTFARDECGPREVFKVCESSSCGEDNCDSRPGPRPCTADCQTGCFCASGYYRRDSDNACVRRSECRLNV